MYVPVLGLHTRQLMSAGGEAGGTAMKEKVCCQEELCDLLTDKEWGRKQRKRVCGG